MRAAPSDSCHHRCCHRISDYTVRVVPHPWHQRKTAHHPFCVGEKHRHRRRCINLFHPACMHAVKTKAGPRLLQGMCVALIFSGGALFPPKSWRPYSVVALKTKAKTAKLTTSTLQISPFYSKKSPLKCDSCSAWGCTYNCHLEAPKFFIRTQCTTPPRLRLCWRVSICPHFLASLTSQISRVYV